MERFLEYFFNLLQDYVCVGMLSEDEEIFREFKLSKFCVQSRVQLGLRVCVFFFVIILYLKLFYYFNVSMWDGYDIIIIMVIFYKLYDLFIKGIYVMEM